MASPVATKPTPKRKSSILMMGKDRKKIAEEASANLQKLGLASGPDDQAEELTRTIDTFSQVEEDSKDFVPPSSTRRRSSASLHSVADTPTPTFHSNSLSDSGRRKSLLHSGLNLGLDLEAAPEQQEVLEGVMEEAEGEFEQQGEGDQQDVYDHESQSHIYEDEK